MHRREVLALAGAALTTPTLGLARSPGAPATLYLIHSIDATTDDNGALNCNRRYLRPYLPNRSTVDVVSNFLSVSSSGSLLARICGHAAPGLINTHCGQWTCGPDTYLNPWNEYYWGDMFKLLRGVVGRLELWGCNPGAKASGADLLFGLAKALQCNVAGVSGKMWCGGNGISFDAGSLWVEATPTVRPTPVEPPIPISALAFEPADGIVILTGEGRVRVPNESIHFLEIRAARQDPLAPAPSVVLRGREMVNALRFLRLDSPERAPGKPLAIATGFARVGYRMDGRDQELRLTIWNDLFATDEEGEAVYTLAPSFEGYRRSIAVI